MGTIPNGTGKTGRGTLARAAISYAAVTGLGLPAAQVARALGVTPMAVLRGLAGRGARFRARGLDLGGVAREMLRKVD